MSVARGKKPGTIQVSSIKPAVVEAIYKGYITSEMQERSFPEFKTVLGKATASHWVIDAIDIDGFDPKVGIAGGAWISSFKGQGGHTMIVVTTSSLVRMLGSTLAFGSGLSVKVVSTRVQALAHMP